MVTEDKTLTYGEPDFVGIHIRDYRKRLKMTQKQLAERVGITENHLAKLEKGKKAASNVVLRKIAKELGICMEELQMGDEFKRIRNLAEYQALCKIYNPNEISEALKIATIYLEAKKQL